MARIAGRLSRVLVSSDGGANFFILGCVQDATLNGSQGEIDVTCLDDGQYNRYIPGRKDATLDLSMIWEEDDPGQAILLNAFDSATELQFKYRPEDAVGSTEFTSLGFITSLSPSSTGDDAVSMDVSARLSGPFNASTQT